MKIVQIFDLEQDNILIDIRKLLTLVYKKSPSFFEGQWCIKEATCGYGEKACEYDEKVNDNKNFFIDGTDFFHWLNTTEDYFYHLKVYKVISNEEIGIFDSTFLYIKTDQEELLQAISEFFKDIKVI